MRGGRPIWLKLLNAKDLKLSIQIIPISTTCMCAHYAHLHVQFKDPDAALKSILR